MRERRFISSLLAVLLAAAVVLPYAAPVACDVAGTMDDTAAGMEQCGWPTMTASAGTMSCVVLDCGQAQTAVAPAALPAIALLPDGGASLAPRPAPVVGPLTPPLTPPPRA